jgi:hypothetical protein
MKKSVDFSKGIRGKHAELDLEIIGAVEKIWAVCITKKEKDLIPFKLYNIERSRNSEQIKVKNESGKWAFYPAEWFALVEVSRKTLGLLDQVG